MNDEASKTLEDKMMISRRIRLAAGIAAACLLGSGVAVAADEDEDAREKTPDEVTEQEVEDMREDAVELGTVLPRESWTTGRSPDSRGAAATDHDGPMTTQQAAALREQAVALQKQSDAMLEQAEVLRLQAEALREQAGQGAAPLAQDGLVTDKEVESLREQAKGRDPKTKESWTTGKSPGREPAPMEDKEKNKDKDDE